MRSSLLFRMPRTGPMRSRFALMSRVGHNHSKIPSSTTIMPNVMKIPPAEAESNRRVSIPPQTNKAPNRPTPIPTNRVGRHSRLMSRLSMVPSNGYSATPGCDSLSGWYGLGSVDTVAACMPGFGLRNAQGVLGTFALFASRDAVLNQALQTVTE